MLDALSTRTSSGLLSCHSVRLLHRSRHLPVILGIGIGIGHLSLSLEDSSDCVLNRYLFLLLSNQSASADTSLEPRIISIAFFRLTRIRAWDSVLRTCHCFLATAETHQPVTGAYQAAPKPLDFMHSKLKYSNLGFIRQHIHRPSRLSSTILLSPNHLHSAAPLCLLRPPPIRPTRKLRDLGKRARNSPAKHQRWSLRRSS